MRYQESKEQSAALLRQVIALMEQHDAPFNPMSLPVWYEFVSGINVWLTQAVANALLTEKRLSSTIWRRGVCHFAAQHFFEPVREDGRLTAR